MAGKGFGEDRCPFCGCKANWDAPISNDINKLGDHSWDCTVCGKVTCKKRVQQFQYAPLTEKDKAMIAAFLFERKLRRIPATQIIEQLTDETSSRPHVVTLDGILEVMRHVFDSPFERMNRGLMNIFRLTRQPGERVCIKHPVVLYAENVAVLDFLADALAKAGHIECLARAADGLQRDVKLTMGGWNRVAELERETRGMDSDQVFVAMWFGDSLKEAYENGIEPAIKEAGYKPMRIDAVEKLGGIDEQIIAEIRRSRFMVADFTGSSEGVYYEAGFAMGLGIPVVSTVRKDEIENLHFDTRQYRHIAWEDAEDLRKRLKDSIEANITKAPSRV